MIYTVKRIDEDLDFGCEERAKDAPVMAVVTLVDSSGEELSREKWGLAVFLRKYVLCPLGIAIPDRGTV